MMDETFKSLGSSFPNQGGGCRFIPPDLGANDHINHSNYLNATRRRSTFAFAVAIEMELRM